ncbi:MAG: hypothetical protein KGY61_02670, partial [Desulfobacterales bacterium]|nr:hypothetical protein [Desulfobacterales bacterium]
FAILKSTFYENVKFDTLVKSGLFRRGGIFAESNSKKHPHCHFGRQREIFSNQDFSSLSLLGMTAAKASKIIVNIVEFLGSTPPGRGPGPSLGVTFTVWLKALRRFIQFCHFERQREILNKQDSSSLLLLGMTES